MRIELDHLFICTATGAPEAERLIQFGLREASPNRHPGQGTANRRFFFANAMIELLWVDSATEAQNESTRRTLLWERWSGRHQGSSPFGICARPVELQLSQRPFPGWEYRPVYLPDSLPMHIGEATVDEPMWIYLDFMRRHHWEQRFTEHPVGLREITALRLTTRTPLQSEVADRVVASGIVQVRTGESSLLEIEFDGHRRKEQFDFRPHLPLIFFV